MLARAALVLLLLPALAAAKPKIVLDAAKPMGPLLEKALKSKYAVSTKSLAESPTGGDVKQACREAGGAIAVVTARAGGGDLVTIMVLNGADGSPLATFRVKAGKKPPKALPKPDLKKLLDGLDDAKPPKKEEAAKPPPEEKKPPPDEEKKPPPEEEKKPPPDEEKPKKRGKEPPSEPPPPPKEEIREKPEEPEPRATGASGEKPMALRVGAGLKLFNRTFGYTDDIFDALSTYRLPIGPAIAADLEVYPAAFLMKGFLANIGVMGTFDFAVGITSKAEDMTRYATTAFNLKVALAVRVTPVKIVTITPFFGYAMQTYSITSSTGAKPNIPSISYGGLRGGGRLTVQPIKLLSADLWFAGQFLVSKGELGTYFPHASGSAIDLGFGINVQVIDKVQVRLSGAFERYVFSMNPVVGDMNIAGGALDKYFSGNFGLALTL